MSDVGGLPGVRAAARSAPAWVRAAFDEVVVGAAPLPWGFRNETWLAELADGRRFAASRQVDRPGGPVVLARIASVQPRLIAAGLPVAALVESRSARAHGVL
ncbi:MAG: hypothetical protein ACXWWR_07515, partial [Candidatus Limnocylindrales bacterium]